MQKLAILLFFTLIFSLFPFPSSASSIADNLTGRILLQVESHGEAWYINSIDNLRYYLGRPSDAFNLMRYLGGGITNADLTKFQVADVNLSGTDTDGDGLSDSIEYGFGTDISDPDTDGDGFTDKDEIVNGYSPLSPDKNLITDPEFTKKHLGRIFLQVQSFGEAWYINPVDNKRYFLGRPDDAFNIMRTVGLGITNKNLDTITRGDISNYSIKDQKSIDEIVSDNNESTQLTEDSHPRSDDTDPQSENSQSEGQSSDTNNSDSQVPENTHSRDDDTSGSSSSPSSDSSSGSTGSSGSSGSSGATSPPVVNEPAPVDEPEPEPEPDPIDDDTDSAYYLQLAYDEADWVVSCVQDSGATSTTPSGAHVDPYYANLGLIGVLELEDSSYYPAVKSWLDWYFANYNSEPDNLGVVGTIYDYILVDGEYIPEYVNDPSRKNYDSSDAYAGTFLSLVWRYHSLTGDTAYVNSHLVDLKNIAGAIDATFNDTNLTSAKPDYSTEYLMDNTEVYRGYADYSVLMALLGQNEDALFYADRADAVATAIELMWTPEDDGYIYYSNHSGGIDWTEFYPDAKASFWPVIFHMQIPESRTTTIYNRLISEQSTWVDFTVNDSPNASTSYIAVLAGDLDTAKTYIENARTKFPDRKWPWKISEGGWLIKTLQELSSQ